MSHNKQPKDVDLLRRHLLLGIMAGTCSSALALPSTSFAGQLLTSPSTPASILNRNRLIVYGLMGGNDGVNTVVPYKDPYYYQHRPHLALSKHELKPLNDELALHHQLDYLHTLYQQNNVAILLDVGHPHSTLSHFVARANWDSGDPSQGETANRGWYGELASLNHSTFAKAHLDAAAVCFSSPLFASALGVPILNTSNIQEFLTRQFSHQNIGANAPMAEQHIAAILNDNVGVQQRLQKRLKGKKMPDFGRYSSPLDSQLKLIDWFIQQHVEIPTFKIAQEGFDTHTSQRTTHSDMLKKFDQSLRFLVPRLKKYGVWDHTVIFVYSEFGRRVTENGGGGTDHGTLGPAFLIGGGVKGGIYGKKASLEHLDPNGNLKFTEGSIDFRQIYSTLTEYVFDLPQNPFLKQNFKPLQSVFI